MRNLSLVLAVTIGGCSGDDRGSGLSCDAVPACYRSAVAALRACIASPSLTLGTPTNNSGTVDNLRCTGANQTVTFSTFSFSPNGTVPLPSSTTLDVGTMLCATVKRSTGTRESGGSTKSFESATIEIPGAVEVVKVNRYDDDTIGVECGPAEITASASSLASCAAQIVSPVVVRDDAITMMAMQLVDVMDASTPLFTCTR